MKIKHYVGDLQCMTKYRMDAILVPTVKHTGTHYIMKVLNYRYAKLTRDGRISIKKKACNHSTEYQLINGHFDCRANTLIEMSKDLKTVIPLRHPALIAVSWKKRPKDIHHQGTFLDEWLKMCEVDNAFHFPLETMPFDELESYTEMTVNRQTEVIHSIGDYPEKKDLQTIQNFLDDDWPLVLAALDTSIGRKFYNDKSLCGL